MNCMPKLALPGTDRSAAAFQRLQGDIMLLNMDGGDYNELLLRGGFSLN